MPKNGVWIQPSLECRAGRGDCFDIHDTIFILYPYIYKKTGMLVDLTKGFNLRVEGEIGKFNTLPIEHLVKLAENLQKLLQDIAKYQLEVDGAIDMSNFKIELAGFKIGSAIPEFVFTPRIKTVTSGDVIEQRRFVNNKFDAYLKVADKGNYTEIKKMIPQAATRNIIVEDLYNFATTFGNSPVSVVELRKGKIVHLYKINKFKSEIKEKLITKISETELIKEEYEAVAKIKVVRTGTQIKRTTKDVFDTKHGEPGFATKVINYAGKSYILAFPLRCKLEKEADYFVIQSEMLDIVGTGKTIDDAEKNFSEEFHFVYNRYNELPNSKLGDRIQRIKTMLNSLVLKIED
jgi:predicted RNase H-like HicB family nuclease